jgi:toxin ParE1/3/4
MRLEISARAIEDIEAIFTYGVEQFGLATARTYYKQLFDLFDLIKLTPEMARQRPDLKFKSRAIKFRSHIVFYRTDARRVRILRILHGRQDWSKYL